MDNGSILFVLFGGPLVIAVVGGAIALLFAAAIAINFMTGAAVRGAIGMVRSRRDKGLAEENDTEPTVGDPR